MPKYIDLEVSLNEAPFPISRKFSIPAKTDLHQLHHYLQIAMGWELSHLHLFETAVGNYSDYQDDMDPTGELPEFDVKVTQVLKRKGSKMTYLYDFGDHWEHTVHHCGSSLRPENQGVTLLDAVGVCPEEDSGGVWNLSEHSNGAPNKREIQDRLSDYYHLTMEKGIAAQTAFCHVHGYYDDDDD